MNPNLFKNNFLTYSKMDKKRRNDYSHKLDGVYYNVIIGKSLLNCQENIQTDDTYKILDLIKSINSNREKDKKI